MSKKIIPPKEVLEFELGKITMMPFKFSNFDRMIEIVNKYFSSFAEATATYAKLRNEIVDRYEDEVKRAEALAALDATYSPDLEIAKGILATGKDAADDVRAIIEACVVEVDFELTDLTAVETMILLGTAIKLNINFFNSNQERMGLKTLFPEREAPQTGTSSLAA